MKLNYPAINTIAETRIAEAKIPIDAIDTIFPVFNETDTVNNSVLESRFCCELTWVGELTFLRAWDFLSAKAFLSAAAFLSAKAYFSAAAF